MAILAEILVFPQNREPAFLQDSNRGDIQVVLRPAENDPISLFTKPVRPPLADLEKELKGQGKTLEQEKENIRAKYRRRPLRKVMEEVEDEVKDALSEHQLKIETIQIMEDELNDLSGANKPVEVKLFGPDDCFGLAWTLLHLIETAPGWPVESALVDLESKWIDRLRERAE